MNIIRQKSIAEQVQDLLRARIREQYYGPSKRLPSEDFLAAELGVSRATIRTALASLASERLVIRKQGDGTFINEHINSLVSRFETIWEFSNLIEESGRACSIKPLGLMKRLPTKEEEEALNISSEEMVISIDRLFLADDDPVILSNNVIAISQTKREVTLDDIRQPLRDFLEKNCGHTLFYAVSDIAAVTPPPYVSSSLELPSGNPVLKFFEVFYNSNNEPLVMAQNYFNTQKLKLRVSSPFS